MPLTGTAAVKQITQLGLDFHLVTRFTSLVAVDNSRVVGDGKPRLVVEALDEPAGVDVAMAGGEQGQQESGADMQPAPAPPPATAADDGVAGEQEAMVDVNEEVASARSTKEAVYAVSQRRPGCGCRTAGGPSGGSLPASLIALALFAVFAARHSWKSRQQVRLE